MNWLRPLSRGVDLLLGRMLGRASEEERFEVAIRLARVLNPVAGKLFPRLGFDLDRDQAFALRLLLRSATRSGFTFIPRVRVSGFPLVQASYRKNRGLILCSGHFNLNGLMTRVLWDRGYRPKVVQTGVVPGRTDFVLGTRHHYEVIQPSPYALVHFRNSLALGGMILVDVESTEPGSRTLAFRCAGKTRYFHPAVFKLARLIGTPVLFYATKLGGNGWIEIEVEEGMAEDAGSTPIEHYADKFANFLVKQVTRTSRGMDAEEKSCSYR